MAESMQPGAEIGHNRKIDPSAIRKLHDKLLPLENKASEIREQMKTLRQEFKADTGISIADFNAARRLAMMEDEDERDGKMDAFRQCYNALTSGQTLDWIEALERDTKDEGGDGHIV